MLSCLQAVAAYEAGLAAEPLNPALKTGLQQAQQGLAAELLSGKTLAHVKALPVPATPERITLTPHNANGVRLSADSVSSSGGRVQRRGHAVGWQGAGDAAAALLVAAEAIQNAAEAAEAEGANAHALSSVGAVAGAAGSYAAGSFQLPKVLLTPAAAEADVGLRDVYEYLSTQVGLLERYWQYRNMHKDLTTIYYRPGISVSLTKAEAQNNAASHIFDPPCNMVPIQPASKQTSASTISKISQAAFSLCSMHLFHRCAVCHSWSQAVLVPHLARHTSHVSLVGSHHRGSAGST